MGTAGEGRFLGKDNDAGETEAAGKEEAQVWDGLTVKEAEGASAGAVVHRTLWASLIHRVTGSQSQSNGTKFILGT